MTKKQVQERIDYWQKRLRLRDWRIRWSFASYHDLNSGPPPGVGAVGDCHIDDIFQIATIRLIHPSEWDNLPEEMRDMYGSYESNIVHEILHISYDSFPECDATEREINRITFALTDEKLT